MSFSIEEFHLALEVIIASRNETGATLSDIQADYYRAFGTSFESLFGNCWTVYVRNLLLNTLNNVVTKQEPGGYSLFFIRAAELKKKLLTSMGKDENMVAILRRLNVDPKTLPTAPNDNGPSSFYSSSSSLASRSSLYVRPSSQKLSKFYNHILIGDTLFLELCNIDLEMPKSRNKSVEQIGLCISGQTIESAQRAISSGLYEFPTDNVILNIGTFDLLSGRLGEDMIVDIVRFLNGLKEKNLKPILTTLAPLPHLQDDGMEEERQRFNKFIRDTTEFIDIEKCFLSSEKRILVDCYQPCPKRVSGSKHMATLWNRVGRQRVLQLLKREIPKFHAFF